MPLPRVDDKSAGQRNAIGRHPLPCTVPLAFVRWLSVPDVPAKVSEATV